jgi:hypothetical protein
MPRAVTTGEYGDGTYASPTARILSGLDATDP